MARLPAAFDLLLTDEPVIDLYAGHPWRVPEGLAGELTARIDALVADGRSARLTVSEHPRLRTPAPGVVAEVLAIVEFLCGAGAVRMGSLGRIEDHICSRFIAVAPQSPWHATAAEWRPPGGPLFDLAGDDSELRALALELTLAVLHALEGIDPLEDRRRALVDLFEKGSTDDVLMRRTHESRARHRRLLHEMWADTATDDIVQALPELAGPVGYLGWVVDGWSVAHERLAERCPEWPDAVPMLGSLLARAGVTEVPAELAVVFDLQGRHDSYAELTAQPADFPLRAWLARAAVAGEVELCRMWLDLGVRLIGALRGLPGQAVSPQDCGLPVAEFHSDVRRLFRVRLVRHPLSRGFAPPVVVPVHSSYEAIEPVEMPVSVHEEAEPEEAEGVEAPEQADRFDQPEPPGHRGQPEPEPAAEAEQSERRSHAEPDERSEPGRAQTQAGSPTLSARPMGPAHLNGPVPMNGPMRSAAQTRTTPPLFPAAMSREPFPREPIGREPIPPAPMEPEFEPIGMDPGESLVQLERVGVHTPDVYQLIDTIIGQPALVAALREITAAPEHPIRLLITGPPGTGRGLAVDVLARLLQDRGFGGEPCWLRPDEFTGLGTASAVARLRDRVAACDGTRLVAIDGLDLLIEDDGNGRALAEELHRMISVYGERLQVTGFAASDGYRRIVDVNAALAAWWRIVRTRDFDASDFASAFARVVEKRGAVLTTEARDSAGELLASTPAEGSLQNARLATYLADLAIDSAGRRSGGLQPTVEVADLPPLRTTAVQ